MKKSIVTAIGAEALNEQEPLIILFDNSATEELKKFSVIQEFELTNTKEINVGNTLSFDHQEYTITHVGPLANEHLTAMGHVTVVFKEIEDDHQLVNALYVSPHTLPVIKEGTVITYA